MNVKDLKKLLKGLPDDMPVVQRGGDHCYVDTVVIVDDAVREGRELTEWDRVSPGAFKVLAVGFY